MNKTLVKTEEEFDKFVNDLIKETALSLEEVEGIFQIDFENNEGQVYFEYLDSLPDDAEEECFEAGKVFRKNLNSDVPEEYPCLILHLLEDDFDRLGSIKYRVCEYVYLSDFNSAP